MIRITEKQFKKLFKILSLILIIDYPLLPFLLSLVERNTGCEYNTLICISLTFLFVAIIAFFWCIIWLMNYITFFMNDYRNKNIKSNVWLPFLLYIKYVQNSYKDKPVQALSIKLILAIFCLGVICLFLYELFLVL